MTAHDPDAWWSPVPGPSEPPARADAYAPTDAQGPWSAEPPWSAPGPAAPGRRRWPWVVSGLTALVLVVAGLGLALGRTGTKTLTDAGGTVSVAVPRSWYDNTGEPGSDPDFPPVLAASNLWQSRWVEVARFDVDDGASLRSFHDEGVEHECATWACTHRSGPHTLVVGGHDAIEQVVTHARDADGGASSSLTLTVWLDDEAVELYAVATATGSTPPDAASLERIAASLRLL
ncbi:hypothetical protein GCM10022197_21870 [Microlunatus spumicola]|uniref:Uncharacterized protein n=1 Tax=Microlunatus spumicola TaxID=81499 RepID=A0ABP6XJE1_9ACTN